MCRTGGKVSCGLPSFLINQMFVQDPYLLFQGVGLAAFLKRLGLYLMACLLFSFDKHEVN